MAVSVVPVPLLPDQVPEAAAVMARAAVDDPLFVHALPEPAARAAGAPLMMEMWLRIGLTFGEVWATPAPITGVACWSTPAHPAVTDADRDAAGAREAATAWGPAAMARFQQFRDDMGEAFQALPAARDWHLMWLCVEPDQQGHGFGGTIVRYTIRQADADAATCSLFTFVPRTVPLYERLGFQIATDSILPRTGLRLWAMTRAPQA
jgi:GNAT superfamily N-acetyltransferase